MKTAISLSAIVLVLGYLVYTSKNGNRMFKQLSIPPTINITNTIENKSYLDTIVAAGLNRLNIDTVDIIISNIPPITKDKFEQSNLGLELEAFIDVKQSYYNIYIGDYSRSKAIDILSHELIHLEQYHSKRLVIVNDTSVLWLGKLYDVTQIQYNDRPWEIEAFEQQNDMSHHIQASLY